MDVAPDRLSSGPTGVRIARMAAEDQDMRRIHRNGKLLGLRSAAIGPDSDEQRPLEQRRRPCGECGRGAIGGLEKGLGAAG